MTWLEIKTLLTAMFPAAMNGLIKKSAGTTTELALYARVTNMEIAGNSHKFNWLLREHQLTLNSGNEYDYNYVPDFMMAYQVPSSDFSSREGVYQSPKDFNVTVGGSTITFFGKKLRIKNGPTSGVLIVPYYSNYLVKDADNVYKKDFTEDTDVSVIPEEHVMMLVEGMARFISRKQTAQKGGAEQYTKKYMLYDGRVADVDPFFYLVQQAILADNPIDFPIRDYRFGQ